VDDDCDDDAEHHYDYDDNNDADDYASVVGALDDSGVAAGRTERAGVHAEDSGARVHPTAGARVLAACSCTRSGTSAGYR